MLHCPEPRLTDTLVYVRGCGPVRAQWGLSLQRSRGRAGRPSHQRTHALQQNRGGFEFAGQDAAHRAAPWPPSDHACRSLQ